MDFSLNQRDIMTTVDNTSDATSDAGALWFNLLSKPAKAAENMRNSRKSKEKNILDVYLTKTYNYHGFVLIKTG